MKLNLYSPVWHLHDFHLFYMKEQKNIKDQIKGNMSNGTTHGLYFCFSTRYDLSGHSSPSLNFLQTRASSKE